MQNKVTVKPGLYRHFKGQYFYVLNVIRDCTTGEFMCQYVNVCHPEEIPWVRLVEDFVSDHDTTEQFGDEMTLYIKDRKDNVTGQTYRFERVENIDFQVSSISTEQLMRELAKRKDSPIRDLDIEGAEALVFSRDYIVGKPILDSVNGNHLASWNAFSTKEEAVKNLKKNPIGVGLFKRIMLIEDI